MDEDRREKDWRDDDELPERKPLRSVDYDTSTVDGARASAETVDRNPLTGLYW